MGNQQSTGATSQETRYVERLRRIQQIALQMALVTEYEALLETITTMVKELVPCKQVVLFVADSEAGLQPFTITTTLGDSIREELKKVRIPIDNLKKDPLLSPWIAGTAFSVSADQTLTEKTFQSVLTIAGVERFYGIPMRVKENLIGIIVLDDTTITTLDQEILEMFAATSAVCLHNHHRHEQTVDQLANRVHEATMLAQLDHELNETIALPMVFTMALDWALRFTNAHCASMALYDSETDSLQTMLNYGYAISDDELEKKRGDAGSIITHRVARSGQIEVIQDVGATTSQDWIPDQIQSQIAVPVIREDRVVAVITLESKKTDTFTDDRITFIMQLANRAAVAIDNARLHDETEREREKLSYIVGNIGDAVIAVGPDDRIVLVSESARSSLRLYAKTEDPTPLFDDTITFPPLLDIYRQLKQSNEIQDEDLTLPNGHDYHVRAIPDPKVGCIIVMRDITPYKETDRLKNELIATVSHDLKQPLGVMRGYLDLLEIKNAFDQPSTTYVERLGNAIVSMRRLIDDLLDLARLESEEQLELAPIPVTPMIKYCIETNRPDAEKKAMRIVSEMPEEHPVVQGEKARLEQVFNNLISNAIKYTPPEGQINVRVEDRGATVRVVVQDNGLGISPEDQPHIFDRFYRVRRPETESIDGTGLGLAIVKTLVDAHHGKIRLESRLGEGTTFYVTLPSFRL